MKSWVPLERKLCPLKWRDFADSDASFEQPGNNDATYIPVTIRLMVPPSAKSAILIRLRRTSLLLILVALLWPLEDSRGASVPDNRPLRSSSIAIS